MPLDPEERNAAANAVLELVKSQLPDYLEDTDKELLGLKMNPPEVKMIPRIDSLNEYLNRSIVEVRELVQQYPEEKTQD